MTVVGLVLVGLAAGTVSATLGVGGGVVFVPALVALFSYDQHLAQGTSLAVIVPTVLVGAWIHARAGRVDWKAGWIIGLGGVVGGIGGAQTALTLDADVLRRLFAGFLVLVAVRLLLRSREQA